MSTPTVSAISPHARIPRGSFFDDAFRPFYLVAAVFTALAIPVWLAVWHGAIAGPTLLPPLYWHMHEMVFGFAVAVIIGFLLTAARNWTGLPLPTGVPLGVLVAIWLAGRVGMFVGYGPTTAVIDVTLLPVIVIVLARNFIRSRSYCSLPLLGVLFLLAMANASFHAALHGLIQLPPMTAVEIGVMLVVLVEMIVGGKVVPSFTAGAIPGVRQYRRAWVHRGAFALVLTVFLLDLLCVSQTWMVPVSCLATLWLLAQMVGWNPLATRGKPMLWGLHVSYAWIPVGLFLLGVSRTIGVPRTAAFHALGVGSMGGLIIGMITRTALGHSGRAISAGLTETAAFLLVQVAAVSRVAAAIIPSLLFGGLVVSGLAWSAAFALYAIAYAPTLLGTRSRTA